MQGQTLSHVTFSGHPVSLALGWKQGGLKVDCLVEIPYIIYSTAVML